MSDIANARGECNIWRQKIAISRVFLGDRFRAILCLSCLLMLCLVLLSLSWSFFAPGSAGTGLLSTRLFYWSRFRLGGSCAEVAMSKPKPFRRGLKGGWRWGHGGVPRRAMLMLMVMLMLMLMMMMSMHDDDDNRDG